MQLKKFERVVLKVFKEEMGQKGKHKEVYAIASWNNKDPRFEIRTHYLDKEGNWKIGKLVGMDIDKIKWLKDNVAEIESFLNKING